MVNASKATRRTKYPDDVACKLIFLVDRNYEKFNRGLKNVDTPFMVNLNFKIYLSSAFIESVYCILFTRFLHFIKRG